MMNDYLYDILLAARRVIESSCEVCKDDCEFCVIDDLRTAMGDHDNDDEADDYLDLHDDDDDFLDLHDEEGGGV